MHDAVFLELAFGMGLGDLRRNFARILKNFALGGCDKAVETGSSRWM